MAAISGEHFVRVGELRLCYDTFGDEGAPPLLMVMGLGAQMVWWDDELCQALADRGLRVIRFDNRDIGRSTILHERGVPSLRQIALRTRSAAAYSLHDMAGDAVGLLEQLGIASAHVVGASMGGMIVQLMAIEHPERVRSLVSIMSTTGNRRVGQPARHMMRTMVRRPTPGREGYVSDTVSTLQMIGSRRYPRDVAALTELAERCYERGHDRTGRARQLMAIVTAADRTERLGSVTVPATVIHGADDQLVRPSGGRATAGAIPGARLLMLDGMAHDTPRPLWPQIIDAIVETTAAA
jgi:pimeloyl-ACP methyl ester carboxylesterase